MRTRTIGLLVAALCAPGLVQAQLHGDTPGAAGLVTWSDCGPGVAVDFDAALTGPLTYQFLPELQTEGLISAMPVWMLVQNDGWSGSFTTTELVHEFQAPGEQIVCLAVQGLTTAWEECAAVTCALVDVLQDSSCAELVVDFTIAAVDGQTVTFQDLSTFPGGIDAVQWSFQGAVSTATTPQHTFTGSGPHRVCLTVTGPPPVQCVRTVCKWLYLGPAPVPCDQLFVPGFVHVVHDRFVAVMDTSATSGMDRTVWWDFGDGTPPDSGRVAVHAYEWPGIYDLCSTVEFQGPLTDGLCAPTHCVQVVASGAMTGLGGPGPPTGPQVHPVPFVRQVELTGLGPGPVAWTLYHMTGGIAAHGTLPGGPRQMLDPGELPPGAYVLRGVQPGQAWTVRLVKE
ncbi:MAG: hypothetical protein RBT71_10760 [Flavobacteriales bacterium]|jgi:PKD repeat protein|nr:hypothetical protein [Flavobacteriales bacterium]